MEEELLLDEAARLYTLARQVGQGSRRLYRKLAFRLCQVATEFRAARQFPEGKGRKKRRRPAEREGRRSRSSEVMR
jgi:hypothetical protein